MKETITESYYNQPKEDSFLYRYITIDKLLDFLFGEKISLVRLNLFEDKLEGISLEHLFFNHKSKNIENDNFSPIPLTINSSERNKLRREREHFQKINFASCWYINNFESVAMWQLYSKPDSVAIKIPYKRLKEELSNESYIIDDEYDVVKYGAISYSRFKDIDNVNKNKFITDKRGFIKDSSFEHEQEFRIIVEDKESGNSNKEGRGIILDEDVDEINNSLETRVKYLKLKNFKELPFEIIFHPESQTWHQDNIRQILTEFNINFKSQESELIETFN